MAVFQGRAAGASLEHSHSQLIGLPIVPELVMEELSGGKFYYNYKERCVFCDMIRQELQQKVRVVLENSEFVAISPFAPRSPFETLGTTTSALPQARERRDPGSCSIPAARPRRW